MLKIFSIILIYVFTLISAQAFDIRSINNNKIISKAAYDINDRMIYVNCSNEAEWFAMINLVQGKKVSVYNYGKQLFNTNCTACHNNSNIGLKAFFRYS